MSKKNFDDNVVRRLISETLDAMDKPTTEEEKSKFLDFLKQKKELSSKIAGYLNDHSEPKQARRDHVKVDLKKWVLRFRTDTVIEEKAEESGYTKVKGKKKPQEKGKSFAEAVKGNTGRVLAANGGSSLHSRGLDPAWTFQEPASNNLLIDQLSGRCAQKLNMEEPVCLARGFAFVTKETLQALIPKYAAVEHPVAFAIETTEKDAKQLKDNIESSIRKFKENEEDVIRAAVSPSIEITSLVLVNSKTQKTSHRPQMLLLVNLVSTKMIVPAHHEKVATLAKENLIHCMPNISFERPPVSSVVVSVVKPICCEIGMESWWQKLSKMTIENLQKELVKAIATKDWMPMEPFIPKSRFLKWRGEEMEEGRIKGNLSRP